MRAFPYYLSLVCGLCLVAHHLQGQSYTFSTVAGLSGQASFADGTGASARFQRLSGVAVDQAGNLYLADTDNQVIRKVTTNWVVTTLAGAPGVSGATDGTNGVARFNYPYGIAVDAAGNLYIADTENHAIRKMTPYGTNWAVTTLAGTLTTNSPGSQDGLGSAARFNNPQGIAVNAAGVLYVADTDNHLIRQVSPAGLVTTLAGTNGIPGIANGTNGNARFNYPAAVALGAAGTLYIADAGNDMIRQISPVGTNWVVTTLAGVQIPGSTDGTNRYALFDSPSGIAADSSGNLYVADTFNDTVRKLTPSGTNWVTTTIGGLAGATGNVDGPGSAARFYYPFGIAVDPQGSLYVADTFNNTLRKGQLAFSLQPLWNSGQLVVTWPAQATNYSLETKTSLAPGVAWAPLHSGIISNGSGFFYTNSTAPAFFRLHKN